MEAGEPPPPPATRNLRLPPPATTPAAGDLAGGRSTHLPPSLAAPSPSPNPQLGRPAAAETSRALLQVEDDECVDERAPRHPFAGTGRGARALYKKFGKFAEGDACDIPKNLPNKNTR